MKDDYSQKEFNSDADDDETTDELIDAAEQILSPFFGRHHVSLGEHTQFYNRLVRVFAGGYAIGMAVEEHRDFGKKLSDRFGDYNEIFRYLIGLLSLPEWRESKEDKEAEIQKIIDDLDAQLNPPNQPEQPTEDIDTIIAELEKPIGSVDFDLDELIISLRKEELAESEGLLCDLFAQMKTELPQLSDEQFGEIVQKTIRSYLSK